MNGDNKAMDLFEKHKDEYYILAIFCQKATILKCWNLYYQLNKETTSLGISIHFYIE